MSDLATESVGPARLGSTVSVRFSEEELARLREVAGRRGVSQFIREAVLDALAPVGAHSAPFWAPQYANTSALAPSGYQMSGYFTG